MEGRFAMPATTSSYPSDIHNHFFRTSLAERDPEIDGALRAELSRQQDHIELIASENIVSRAVLEAQGSILTNKYAEGYPGRRYYGGCEHVDVVESLAIERAKKLFDCEFANVQPHSGAQANGAVYLALMQPADVLMGMSLAAGGHLTHGAPPAQSGKWFKAVQYGVRREDALIDFEEVERLALEHRPKVIVAGGSAYPRIIDFARFREIADKVGALLLVDMAHFAGLVAAKVHPSPFPHAHVVTTTTHKTLRGPRGGMILTRDPELAKKINSAVFPGLQGGPLMHVIAAKAVSFGEVLRPEFRTYAKAVVENAKVLASALMERGLAIVAGGTDTHLILVDLRAKAVTGKAAEESLGRAYLTCNKNGIPFDPEKPGITSGIRLGSPAGTTRGFGPAEFRRVAELIADVLDGLSVHPEDNSIAERAAREQVLQLTRRFPIYSDL
jgi:glycine hydroxymethyltransferase